MTRPRICIVEPCHSHEEVVLPLVDLLRDDWEVHVAAPDSLLTVDLLRDTRGIYAAHSVRWDQRRPRWRRLADMPRKYRELRRIVDEVRPEFVVFNSTYGFADLACIVHAFRGVRKAQVIHNADVFARAPARRWAAEFDLNLVLSEEVHAHLVASGGAIPGLDHVLPIVFESFEALNPADPAPGGDVGPLRLGVFGSVDASRRNYRGLLDRLAAWRRPGRACGFTIDIVGAAPAWLLESVVRHGLDDVVRCGAGFVPFADLFRILRRTDLVLFLVDASVDDCARYNRTKITGSSTLVKAFRRASIASNDFRLDAVLADACVRHDGDRIDDVFEAIASGRLTRADARAMERTHDANPALSREAQKTRLAAALRRAMAVHGRASA